MDGITEKLSEAWTTQPEGGRNARFEKLLRDIAIEEGEDTGAYASALNEYASYLRVNGLYERGAEIFERALSAIEAIDGRRTAYATCLSNYAELRRLAGDFEACDTMLAEARLFYKNRESIEYAANLNYQAHLYESLQEEEKSLAAQAESLEIIEKCEPGSPDLACAHQNLGSSHLAYGRLDDANEELKIADSLYCMLGIRANAHIVALHNTLGCVYEKQGRLEDALHEFEKALLLADECKMNPDERSLVERNAARAREATQ